MAGSYALRLTGGEVYRTDVSDRYVQPLLEREGEAIAGSRAVASPFSDYIAVAAEVGFLGLLILVAIYAGAFVAALRRTHGRLAPRAPRSPDGVAVDNHDRLLRPASDGTARKLAGGDAADVHRLGPACDLHQGVRRLGSAGESMKRRLVVVGPLPPPHHGVAVSTSLVLQGDELRRRFEVEHFDTSDHRTLQNVGRWDATNIGEALTALGRFAIRLRGAPGIVYLPVSQGLPGLTRDTLFIRIASARGWKVVAHLRGSELGDVYRRQPRVIRLWLRRAFGRLDSLAVLGESLRPAVTDVVPASKVAVVPNGTPDPGLNGQPQSTERALFLGNLLPRKGVLEAFEAAQIVIERRPNARFVFVGDCPDESLASRAPASRAADPRENRRPIAL